jgi:predicted phosphodiesterase
VSDDVPEAPETDEQVLVERARELMARTKKAVSIEFLADALDVAPKRAREAVDTLRRDGFRVIDDDSAPGAVRLEKLPPATPTVTRLALQGDEVTIGIVSDTHLGSREEALPELIAVYEEFEARDIDTVLHAGDLTAGIGIYRGQQANGLAPGMTTYNEQVDYACAVYPRIEGITTYMIAGNHDIEGEAGRVGFDPVKAVSHRRPDIIYCGAYHGSLELPNGAHATMVHGRGGGGYAISYKPQRYVESLPPGRKPALLIFGHWHVSGFFRHRQVTCLLAGCFEWQTDLLVRLGLQPDVGAWIVTLRLGDDGSVVGIKPEWLGFYAGRKVEMPMAA